MNNNNKQKNLKSLTFYIIIITSRPIEKRRYTILFCVLVVSRAEGEEVMDRVARREGANIYYLRIPGHGTNIDDLARYSYRDFLDTSIEALMMMPRLGERAVVAGTSMGGTIATWLAAHYPEKVDGLILCPPSTTTWTRWGASSSIPAARDSRSSSRAR